MADNSQVCNMCNKDFATYGCCCTFPVPVFCQKAECINSHHTKNPKASHNEIPLDGVARVTQENLRDLKVKFVNIEEGKDRLENNLKAVEACKASVKEYFVCVRGDLDDIEQTYLRMLDGYYGQIMEAIHNAVKDARAMVFEPEWPADLVNPLAKMVWEYGSAPSSPDLVELFQWDVSRPDVDLKGLVNVQMYSKRFSKLALVVNHCLHEFDTQKQKWSSVRLQGVTPANFKVAWDSVSAYYADNLRLLCTGGSTPMTNTSYEIEVMTGKVTEKGRMRYSRSGHGMCQYQGKFYVFGGNGAKRMAEKYEPEEDNWLSLPNMAVGHHWFTTCIHNNQIYLCGGNSAVVEIFSPATEEYIPTSLQLEGNWAEASFSIASVGEDIAFISPRGLLLWTPDRPEGNLANKPFAKALESVWSCMTPVSDGVRLIFLPDQKEKCVKCFDLITLRCKDISVPELVDLPQSQ